MIIIIPIILNSEIYLFATFMHHLYFKEKVSRSKNQKTTFSCRCQDFAYPLSYCYLLKLCDSKHLIRTNLDNGVVLTVKRYQKIKFAVLHINYRTSNIFNYCWQ